jgi:hypothetical protein
MLVLSEKPRKMTQARRTETGRRQDTTRRGTLRQMAVMVNAKEKIWNLKADSSADPNGLPKTKVIKP